MALTLTSLTQLSGLGFDTVIDVRSPAEYSEDHLPGAVNLPVLDNEERARIGTIYKQQSAFLARKQGAALVARNAALHLEGKLADKPGGWRPLVYCWRGGQRSGSFASILQQVGWRAELVEGGYKSWRALVVAELGERPVAAPVVVLDGNTGTAKTDILGLLAVRGVQTIDLEGLAHHRGSLFGHRAEGQPSQKAFEGRLAMALATLDPACPVVIEAESSRIGNLTLPKQIWAAMKAAPRLRIAAPLAARAEYLARAYVDLTEDRQRLMDVVQALRHAHPAERIGQWVAMAQSGAFVDLAEALMRDHYDQRYEKHRARSTAVDTAFETESLAPEALQVLADRLTAHLSGMARP
ncbi:MAG: tRNA 2-selenouridine(34) synthase MnmH [Albidovulum sp.]